VREHNHSRAATQVLAAALLFGTTGTVLVNAPDAANAASVGVLRLLIGGITLFALARRGRHRPTSAGRASLLIGCVGVAVFQLGYFFAVERTGVAVGTVTTIGAGPVAAGFLAAVSHRKAPARSWLLGTALSIAGVALLGLAGRSVDVDDVGIVLAIVAGAGWAVFSTIAKHRIDSGDDSTVTMATIFTGGALLVSPMLLWHSPAWATHLDGLLIVLYLGVATVGIAYWMYGLALRHLAAPTVVTLTLLEPITAAVLGSVVVHEELRPAGWLGIAVVLGGLVVTTGGAVRSARLE